MSKMRTPAMEKIEKKNAKRKKPVKSTPMRESWKRFKRNPTALIGLGVVCILILVAIFAPLIAPYDYKVQDYSAMMQAPSSATSFEPIQFGRDIFSRVIYGTRYSLIIALFCTIAALFSGGLLGIIAGYFGGTVDTYHHACHGYFPVDSDDHDGNVYRCGTWKRYSAACRGDHVCIHADDGKK